MCCSVGGRVEVVTGSPSRQEKRSEWLMADVAPISVPRREGSSRLPFVDALRAFASNVIVWHHLAYYGPLSDFAYELAPVSIDFLYLYGRMIVAVFLVVGGFVTAQNINPLGEFGGARRLDSSCGDICGWGCRIWPCWSW